MAYFVDQTGRLVEANVRGPEDLEELRRKGYRPALDTDIQQHNEAEQIKAADEGGFSGRAALEAGQRAVGGAAGAVADLAGITGTRPGLADEGAGAAEQLFPEASSDEARLRAKAHPFSAGVGTGLAAAPAAIPAGMAAGAAVGALGAGALATTGATILGEQAVEAVAQEYDDAWLQERPMELKNVATYTAMFSLGDGLFRGLGKGLGKLFGAGEKRAAGGLGARNIVAESNAQLRKEAGPLKGRPRSVGAASAADIDEPFESALKTMSERDAAVLDRDADDYLSLVATHASDGMNRLRRGLDEDLSNLVKYQDFEKGAEGWTRKNLEAQAAQLAELSELGQSTAAKLRARPTDELSLDYGNMGRVVAKTIDDFTRRINSPGTGPARLNYLTDEFKKRLDSHMMKIDASFSVDAVTRKELKEQIRPLVGQARDGLMDTGAWGANAKLQRELNPGWHQLLKHWSGIQQKLYERTGETLYDHSGAGRIVMESTTRRMFDMLQQDPRMRKELGQHLSGAFDGLTDLVNARRRNGIVQTDNLDRLLEDIAGLKDDWNLASTVGVARNMTAHAKKDPRRWAEIAKELAARAPVVGGGIGAADRALGRIMQGTRLEKGTPLADVWDRGLSRYAKHPDLADPSISRNYSEWMREMLKEHGGKVAGAGLLGLASQAEDDDQGASMAGAGALALLGGKTGRRMFRLGQRTARKQGEEWFDKRVTRELGELADDSGWASSRAKPGDLYELHMRARGIVNDRLTKGERTALKEYTSVDYVPTRTVEAAANRGPGLDVPRLLKENPELTERMTEAQVQQAAKRVPLLYDAARELSLDHPTKYGPLYRGISVDADGLSELLTRDDFVTHSITSTTFDPETAKVFGGGQIGAGYGAILRIRKAALGAIADNPTEAEVLIPAGAKFKVTGRAKAENGTTLIVDLEQVGEADPAKSIDAGVLAAILGIGGAAAASAPSTASAAEPPPENARPEVAYRRALEENARGGAALAQTLGVQMFRGAKGKAGGSAIDEFARGGGLEAATERLRGALQEIGEDPGALIDRVAGTLGELPRTHPGVYSEMVGKATQIVGYLERVIPQRRGASISQPEGFAPSYDEMIDFAQRVAGATTPVVVARRLARGEASPLELEALRENWPEWIAQLQAGALGAVSRAAEEGTSMSPELLGRLDRDLGMDGALDPMQGAGMADYLLRVFAADDQRQEEQQQGAGQSGGGGAQSTRYQTRLGSVRTQRQMQ